MLSGPSKLNRFFSRGTQGAGEFLVPRWELLISIASMQLSKLPIEALSSLYVPDSRVFLGREASPILAPEVLLGARLNAPKAFKVPQAQLRHFRLHTLFEVVVC